MQGTYRHHGKLRTHEIVASWERLDEQARFELFAHALLDWCGEDEDAARSLWTELETLRCRNGGLPAAVGHRTTSQAQRV